MPKYSTYKEKAKALKRAGLIEYDLRRTLTPQQKAVITRKWKGTGRGQSLPWGNILTRDDIVTRTVSPKKAETMRRMGYAVSGRRVYIDTEGYREIHVRGNKIIKKGGKGGKEIIDFVIDKKDILATLKRLSKQPRNPNETLTVKIGNNGPFRQKFVSYTALLNYLTKWKPKKDFDAREELINQMSIVKFNK